MSLRISEMYVQTEGEGFIHEHGQASSSEKVYVFVRLHAEEAVSPFALEFWVDSTLQSGSSHVGMSAGETEEMWFQCGPLHTGHYTLSVTCTSEDGSFETASHQIVLEVVPGRRHAIPDDSEGGNGWHLANVQFRANNFLGTPMRGDRFYLRLVQTSGHEAAHDGTVEDGVFSLPQVWVPTEPNATMVLSIWAHQGGENVKLERSFGFELKGDAMVFDVEQEHDDIEVAAKDEETAAHRAGAKGSAGIDWKIVSVGGEISSEDETSRTHGRETRYKVRVPKSSMKVAQVR